MKIIAFVILMLASTVTAHACTLCNSKTATAVRASIFGKDMLFNLAVTVLPFAVCLMVVYGIYHGGFVKSNSK